MLCSCGSAKAKRELRGVGTSWACGFTSVGCCLNVGCFTKQRVSTRTHRIRTPRKTSNLPQLPRLIHFSAAHLKRLAIFRCFCSSFCTIASLTERHVPSEIDSRLKHYDGYLPFNGDNKKASTPDVANHVYTCALVVMPRTAEFYVTSATLLIQDRHTSAGMKTAQQSRHFLSMTFATWTWPLH